MILLKKATHFFTQNIWGELGLQLVEEKTQSISFNKDQLCRSFEGGTVEQNFNWFLKQQLLKNIFSV